VILSTVAARITDRLAPCIADDQLLFYLHGDLSVEERDAVDVHLVTCTTCCELVGETAALIESTKRSVVETHARHRCQTKDDERPCSDLLPAGTIVGRYRILHAIGQGGMCVVYAAHDPELHRRVAIKLLRPELLHRDAKDFAVRMWREARAMARVTHPNVVGIHDVGEWEGRVFVAMELVVGATLREHLKSHDVDGPARLDLLLNAGRGLVAAHVAGLVHRDFKPGNILVGADGRVRVTDFGLARPSRAVDGLARPPAASLDILSTVTTTGEVCGTPAYMAPEQFTAGPIDARADQFAFSITLHEALYGKRPFAGKVASEIATNMFIQQLVPIDEETSVPASIHAILRRGLARTPEERYPSLACMLEELEQQRLAWAGDRTPPKPSDRPITTPERDAPERLLVASLPVSSRMPKTRAVSIAVVIGVALVGLAWGRSPRDIAREDAPPLGVASAGASTTSKPSAEVTESAVVLPSRTDLAPLDPNVGRDGANTKMSGATPSTRHGGTTPARSTRNRARRGTASTTSEGHLPIGDGVEDPF